MEKISERFKKKERVLFLLKTSSEQCFSDNTYKDAYIIEEIGNGEDSECRTACIPATNNKCLENSVIFVLKLLPNILNKYENDTLVLCQELLKNKKCPNLPIVYSITECTNCNFTKSINQVIHTNCECGVIVNEFADLGDLNNWLKIKHESEIFLNCLFQIFCGIYTLYKYYNISHNDLHFGNILVHSTNKGGYWKYIIDGITYYCPNYGYLFTLWDFGYSSKTNRSIDHIKVCKLLENKVSKQLKVLIKQFIQTDIKNVFELFKYSNISNEYIIEEYNI